MNCSERDPDLLLLAHGELDFWRKPGIWLHIVVCPTCRHRHQRFLRVSGTLFAATRGSMARAALRTAVPAALLVVMLLTVAAGMFALKAVMPAEPFRPAKHLKPRCAPDLPSDRCW